MRLFYNKSQETTINGVNVYFVCGSCHNFVRNIEETSYKVHTIVVRNCSNTSRNVPGKRSPLDSHAQVQRCRAENHYKYISAGALNIYCIVYILYFTSNAPNQFTENSYQKPLWKSKFLYYTHKSITFLSITLKILFPNIYKWIHVYIFCFLRFCVCMYVFHSDLMTDVRAYYGHLARTL